MLAHVSEEFAEQARKFGIESEVETICERIEAAPSIDDVRQVLDSMVPYYKARIGRHRVIGRVYRVGDREVFCFLTVFARKDPAYEEFVWRRREWGDRHLEPHVDLDTIGAWAEERTTQDGVVDAHIDPLPPSLEPWLTPPWGAAGGLLSDNDVEVYESKLWVERFGERAFREFWSAIHPLVIRAVEASVGDRLAEGASRVEGLHLLSAEVGKGAILYWRPPTMDGILLVAPFLDRPDDAAVEEALAEAALTGDQEKGPEFLRRRARRAYPAYVLADYELWKAIESDREANLALSGEEEELLRAVALPTDSRGLPLFVNGRAGSGKSTMLSYLFAAFCGRKFVEELPGHPMFLTYNERLLEIARKGVHSLLSASHQMRETDVTIDLATIDDWFVPFREHLLGRLGENSRSDFDSAHHVAFHHFKTAYAGQPGRIKPSFLPERSRWSPELCWYVIRTFIKGYSSVDFLDADSYAELPRAERVVSEQDFSAIHDSIWDRWYLPAMEEAGLWDDQDLVAAALAAEGQEEDDADPVVAVFCDEAQDFTRRELMLLVRSCAILQFDLSTRTRIDVPLVFAGDPLQTLNPTGFRWESIQAGLHEELTERLGPESVITVRLAELEKNYRSARPIVEFVNGIQLWRHVLFGIEEIRPQQAWDLRGGPAPFKFILGDNLSEDDLLDLVQDTIILLPCEEGGELDFVQGDALLSRLFPEASEENRPRNVLSATLAKGCEFGRVIIYKFGESCPSDLWSHTERTEESFGAEFFLNKLYVAASRARERLLIVDTPRGDERLWQQSSMQALADHTGRAKSPDIWHGSVLGAEFAPSEATGELRDTNPEETARVMLEQAVANKNADLARMAGAFFERLGDDDGHRRALAHAGRFHGDLVEAGREFLDLGDDEDAWSCFWESEDWTRLAEWSGRAGAGSRNAHRAELPLVVFMTGTRNSDALVDLSSHLSELASVRRLPSPMLSPWRAAVQSFIDAVNDLLLAVDQATAGGLALTLAELADRHYEGARSTAAACFYRSGDTDAAVRMWERARDTHHFEYAAAKCDLVGAPEGLQHLNAVDDPRAVDDILRRWDAAGAPRERAWLVSVAPALERSGRFDSAFEVRLELGDAVGAADLVEQLSKTDEDLVVAKARELAAALGEGAEYRGVNALTATLPNRGNLRAECLGAAINATVARAASSGWTWRPGPSAAEDLERLLKRFTGRSDWEKILDPTVVGAAFELTGTFTLTLKFYERFVDDSRRPLRDAARTRWLRVKAAHIDYEHESGRRGAYDRARRQRANRAHDWGISENATLPEHPTLAAREQDDLTLTATPRSPSPAVSTTYFEGLEVSISPGTVRVHDLDTMGFCHIDLEAGQVRLPGSAPLDLSITDGVEFGFGDGYLLRVDTTKAELHLTGKTGTTSLPLTAPTP